MSVYVLEVTSVTHRRDGAVGHGIDERGNEYEIALDRSLATHLEAALVAGGRPIVTVEAPLRWPVVGHGTLLDTVERA